MPRAHDTWQPMFLAEPATFSRILAQPLLSRRMQCWPGFQDMLVGEAIRHGRRADPDALDALRSLYAFGLENGLPVRARLEAVAAVREHLACGEGGARPWEPFLLCETSREVALQAARAWLDSDPAAPPALCAMIGTRACASPGAAFGALLRRGPPGLLALAATLRDALEPVDVAEALRCCDGSLPPVSRIFLADWLDGLDVAGEPMLADLLGGAVLRQARLDAPDARRVADHFLPVTVSAPIALLVSSRNARARRPISATDLLA